MGLKGVEKFLLKSIAGGLMFSSIFIYAEMMDSDEESDGNNLYSPKVRQWSNQESSGNKSTKQKAEVTESELLSNLDKEGRALYLSLDNQGKKTAREIAAQSGSKGILGLEGNARDAVETAADKMAERTMKLQDRRLHNGMDRLPGKKQDL